MTHKSRKEEILFGLYYISNIHHCVVIISMTPKSKKKKQNLKQLQYRILQKSLTLSMRDKYYRIIVSDNWYIHTYVWNSAWRQGVMDGNMLVHNDRTTLQVL